MPQSEPAVPLTRAKVRELFVGAALTAPAKRLPLLASRLATQVGAIAIDLVEVRCGRQRTRELTGGDPVPRDATEAERELYGVARPTPVLEGHDTIVVSIPAGGKVDPLRSGPSHAVLLLRFPERSPFVESRRQSWNALRLVGNLTNTLLDGERAFRLDTELRRLRRRSINPRRPADIAYLAMHAVRDVLDYDGHCTLLAWEPGEDALTVMAHLAEDTADPDSRGGHDLSVRWDQAQAAAVLDPSLARRCYLTVDGRAGHVRVTQIGHREETLRIRRDVDPSLKQPIAALLGALRDADLARGRSALVVPLHQRETSLGVLVVSATAESAFDKREVAESLELALECIAPLGRARRLGADFRLSEQVLERTARLEPGEPIEENRPLIATLTLLCERLRRVVDADAVVLLPYAYRRGILLSRAMAWAGTDMGLPDSLDETMLARLLHAGETVEWNRAEDTPDPTALGAVRAYAVPLRDDDGNRIGAVFVGWQRASEEPEDRRTETYISRLDKQQIDDFRGVAEAHLVRHNSLFTELKSQRLLSQAYGTLLGSIDGGVDGDETPDYRAARDAVIERLLGDAVDLIGGTTGVFVERSGEHAGLDVVAATDRARVGTRLKPGVGVVGRVVETGKWAEVTDYGDRSSWPSGLKPAAAADVRSELAFPLTDGSGGSPLLGAFSIANAEVVQAYGEADLGLAKRIGQVAAIAIGLTRQLEQMQSIAWLAERIDVANRRSEDAVFEVALAEATRVTGAFAASARRADRSGTRLLPVHHEGDRGAYHDKAVPVSKGVNGAAFRRGREVLIGDTLRRETYPRVPNLQYLPSRKDTRCECAIPIQWTGHRIGACNFEHRQPFALVPYQMYLKTIGAQIGHALQQRRDQESAVRKKGIDLVMVLSTFYMTVNHVISRSFMDIEAQLATIRELAGDALPPGAAKALAQADALATSGTADAKALLQGASGALERPVVIDVKRLIDNVEAKVREQRGEVALEVVDAPGAHEVVARESMLGWILHEVIDNSYAHAGSDARVSVLVKAQPTSGSIALIVDDDGPGIPEKRRATLYDVAHREERDGRHGLALIAAGAYLHTMNGRIDALESPRGGLRTVIELPLHRDPREALTAIEADEEGM